MSENSPWEPQWDTWFVTKCTFPSGGGSCCYRALKFKWTNHSRERNHVASGRCRMFHHKLLKKAVEVNFKYFVILPMSATGNKFTPVTFQIDNAATCNALSEDILLKVMPKMKLTSHPTYYAPMATLSRCNRRRLTFCKKETKYTNRLHSRYFLEML